jgi:glycosyltransferase involved in cell wall biosynthesis/GT2 family glycosyltransferase
MTSDPSVSIVICTDGRAAALANTLDCLQHLDGPEFEACVVHGPTEDGTRDVLAGWEGRIKLAQNPERNLSRSRNIGIGMSAGEVVAFVDDDGLPESDWLPQILRAFEDPRVAGAGGIVMDHTGARVQYYYCSANRLGNADWQRTTPADDFNFPLSFNFPYVQGTNSAFRRDVLMAIGGFDEEFEFYLDETDLCCRLVDEGWLVKQLPDAVVHHKFLPSAIRTNDRITRVLYPVLKNKLYFSLVNNHCHYPIRHAIEDMTTFVRMHEGSLRHHVEAGRLPPGDLETFVSDADRAWSVGLERGLSNRRRLMTEAARSQPAPPFLLFPRRSPAGGKAVVVFVSQEYPPGRMGGIGRYVHQLARAVASAGHHVHVVTRGEGHDRVDFEDGAWVHRVVPRPCTTPPPPSIPVPPHIWAHAVTMLEIVRGIADRQPVTAVYAPIWDCEGVAILLDGKFPLITGLQTTLRFWLDSHPHTASDPSFSRDFAEPMLAIESLMLRESDGVHAISAAIARDVAAAYGVPLEAYRTRVVPLGLDDWSDLPSVAPKPLPPGTVRVLFVGRLERRKGIDVLLEAASRLLLRQQNVFFDVVGNDQIPGPDGATYRAVFEATAPAQVQSRVRFHGEVAEERLRGFYRACDVFVAPSRFESFGLILVEAMMYAKPAVACRAGGMVEIAEEGHTALLAEPGDVGSLERCLERLIVDSSLRETMGQAARRRFEEHFAPTPMAEGVIRLVREAAAGSPERRA